MSHPTVSVVIPVYNEGQGIQECYKRLTKVMEQADVSYDLVFVNDGSVDNSRQQLERLADIDSHVKLINFSRNFGHQIAITAGMDFAQGDAVVIIDADMQDPPEVILQMLTLWREGYQVVYAKRIERKGETWFKLATAKLFYRLLNKLSTVAIPKDVGDFRLLDRAVVNALNQVRESSRFVRGLVSWVGFKQTAVEYVREPRFAGETKYPLHKMLAFAANAVISFSFKPLRFATYLGFFSVFGGFIYLATILYQKFFTDELIHGWASLMTVSLFFNGVILIILGIIGEYIGRIFTECKRRPLYFVESTVGIEEREKSEANR